MESATQGVKRIHCGDSVLPIRLSGLNGSEVNLYHPRFAGSSIVLWLTEESPATATLRAVARRHQEFGAVEARLFNLVSGVDAPAEKTKEVRGLTQMFDPERRLLAAFGLAGAGIAVVGPDLRLAGVLEGEDFDAAFRLCQALHARTERTVLTAQAPVLFVPDVLDAETCLALVDYWHAGEKRADKVTSDSVGGERSDAPIKKRQDVILLDEDLIALVKKRISERVVPELIKAFHFRAASLELLRIGCYDSAERGRFVRHRDNTDPYSAHRPFAMSLNLNDDAFEGGQVRFPECGRMLYSLDRGGALLFSCTLLHEALPVSAGKRFAMFTFFTDQAGVEQENKMKASSLGRDLEAFATRPSGARK